MINVDEVKNVEESKIDFPKIMQHKTINDLILFFSEYGRGIVLKTSQNGNDEKITSVGTYQENWFMEFFQDYNEPLVIRNIRKS